MAGKSTRDKGRRGETMAKQMLTSRDWIVADLSAGLSSEDLLAISPDGKSFAVEVKNTVDIKLAHLQQAKDQAKKRKTAWMLMSHIPNTSCWLIQRQGFDPIVWKVLN